MDINRRDLITIILLSTIFFSVATWNLGLTQVPITNWQAKENKTIYIELSETANVSTIYFLVKKGSANVQIYTGSLGDWSDRGSLSISDSYYSWQEVDINSLTQHVRIDVYLQPDQPAIELVEIAILNSENQQIAITAITSVGAPDADYIYLFDEQNLIQLPPTYTDETIFDEVYFVKTAEQYLNFQVPFEWTHPPLGKLFIAFGISIFGYNPFGWRIMGVIFATLMIPLIYILGKKLFKTWIGAFAPAFLFTFDFIHFTMARMATVDTFMVFFSLASQLFFLIYLVDVLKNGWKTSVRPLFLAILFFAFGFSTKWLVFYGFVAQLVILAALRFKEVAKLEKGLSYKINAFLEYPYFKIVGFLLMALLVYFLIYIPDLLAGRSVAEILGLQWSMFEYHGTLDATHPFSSPWWSWPLMLKPVWLYVSYLPLNMKSTIAILGNPAVWWVGFACIFLALKRAMRNKDFVCMFISAFFFFQWLPFIFISRITFLYHFYVTVPFLYLASTFFINKYWTTKWGKIIAISYFAGLVVLFGLFYSVISGTSASRSWIDSLKWLNGWSW